MLRRKRFDDTDKSLSGFGDIHKAIYLQNDGFVIEEVLVPTGKGQTLR